MRSDIWNPAELRELADKTPSVLQHLATMPGPSGLPETRLLASEGGAIAVLVPVQSVLDDPSLDVKWGGTPRTDLESMAICASDATTEDSIRSLLEQLKAGELAPEPPRWALAGPGRSAIGAYRAAGPTATIRFQDDDGDPVKLTLFPIRLPDLDSLQESLTPESKLPEGRGDHLDKREDWFQGRSGKDD